MKKNVSMKVITLALMVSLLAVAVCGCTSTETGDAEPTETAKEEEIVEEAAAPSVKAYAEWSVKEITALKEIVSGITDRQYAAGEGANHVIYGDINYDNEIVNAVQLNTASVRFDAIGEYGMNYWVYFNLPALVGWMEDSGVGNAFDGLDADADVLCVKVNATLVVTEGEPWTKDASVAETAEETEDSGKDVVSSSASGNKSAASSSASGSKNTASSSASENKSTASESGSSGSHSSSSSVPGNFTGIAEGADGNLYYYLNGSIRYNYSGTQRFDNNQYSISEGKVTHKYHIVEYTFIKTNVYGCNGCGYPLFTRTGSGVSNFSDLYSHPESNGCTGKGYHSEIYRKGYCSECGGTVEDRSCSWTSYFPRCSKNMAAGSYQKVGDRSMYFQSCSCGANSIVTNQNGNGEYYVEF